MRELSSILNDYAIAQTSVRTGLEYPFKSNFVIESGGVSIRLSADEVDFIETVLININDKYPDFYELLKLKYFKKLPIEKIAIKLSLSTPTAHRRLSEANGYILAKLDEKIKDLIK